MRSYLHRKGKVLEVKVENILFHYNSIDISKNKESIDDIADFAMKCSEKGLDYVVKVIGYADTKGLSEYNQRLSTRRAEKVADLLVDAGIDNGKIEFIGKGESDIIKSKHPYLTYRLNRRIVVEFELFQSPDNINILLP